MRACFCVGAGCCLTRAERYQSSTRLGTSTCSSHIFLKEGNKTQKDFKVLAGANLMARATSGYNRCHKPLCQAWSSDKEIISIKASIWTLQLYYPGSVQVSLIQDDTFKKLLFLWWRPLITLSDTVVYSSTLFISCEVHSLPGQFFLLLCSPQHISTPLLSLLSTLKLCTVSEALNNPSVFQVTLF